MKNLLFLCIVISYSAVAQKMEVISGSLKNLKGQRAYDIRFVYDSMIIGVDKPEKDYLNDLKTRWDAKEPGKGSRFVEVWFDDRKRLYEPAFIKSFEFYSKVELNNEKAKYTIIVKTTHTEGGWSLGPLSSHAGEIGGELWIVESADYNNIVCKINFHQFRGEVFHGGDFEMTTRIKSAYDIAGKFLGFFLKRKTR